MFRLPLLLSIGVLALGVSARADIIAGADVSGEAFSEVFAVARSAGPGYPEGAKKLCTAVLVHPRVLLTGAGCLPEEADAPVDVLEGNDVARPAATYRSARTERNSFYFVSKDEYRRAGYDLGAIFLDRDVVGADPRTGAKLARFASVENPGDLAAARRDGVVVVGFGGRYNALNDASAGVKRWARTRLSESLGNSFTTDGPRFGLSEGDSGGPAFIVDADGRRRLIGIASGAPAEPKLFLTGLPESSLYAAMRPKVVRWIERVSGFPFPENPAPETALFGAK